MATDGTHQGQFSSFELAQFPTALGFLSRESRDKDCNWGTSGWIPSIPKDKSQGRRFFVDSSHTDSTRFCAQLVSGEGPVGVQGSTHTKQGQRAAMSFVPTGLKELQKTGFAWDSMRNGKLHKGVETMPLASFLGMDTKEANLFCGKFPNRNTHIVHLCHECCCPAGKSDNHLREKLRIKLPLWPGKKRHRAQKKHLNRAF